MREKPEAEKLSHGLANYTDPSPFRGKRCGICEHFIKPAGCTGVKSPIDPRAWCARYDAKA